MMLTLAAFNARRARGHRPAPAGQPVDADGMPAWLTASTISRQACPRCGADLASPDPVPLHQLPGPHDIDPDAPTADDIAAAARASAAHQDPGTPPAAPPAPLVST